MSRRSRALWIFLTLVLVLPLLGLAALYASVSGGWDDAFRPKKTASSGDVREARKQADDVVAKEAAALGLAPDEPREVCREGQHNWKVDEDYDISCELVAVADVGGGRIALYALHDRLAAAGWQPESLGGIPEALSRDGRVRFAYYARGTEFRLTVQWSAAAAAEATLRYRFYRG